MTNCLNLLVVLMMLVVSSCVSYPPPKGEICLVTKQGDAACDDNRLNQNNRSYFRELDKGDTCTNPSDYQRFFDYAADLRKKLIACERRTR